MFFTVFTVVYFSLSFMNSILIVRVFWNPVVIIKSKGDEEHIMEYCSGIEC